MNAVSPNKPEQQWQEPTRFGDVAVVLASRGYRPIPLHADTKIPMWRKWTQCNLEPWSGSMLKWAVRKVPDAACGYAVPADMHVLDIDILDQDIAVQVANIATDILGKTPLLRIGQAPKLLQIRRSDGSTRSVKKHHPVEMFSGSGQVALFGWHPKAGRPYLWPGKSPLDIDAHDPSIPMVTNDQVEAFLEQTEALRAQYVQTVAAKRGAVVGASKHVGAWVERWKELSAFGPTRAALTIAHEAVATGLGRHDAVFFIIHQWVREGKSPDELLHLLERCAPDLITYVDNGDDYTGRVVNHALDARDNGQAATNGACLERHTPKPRKT